MNRAALALIVVIPTSALAQESAHYGLHEYSFSAGGHPSGGIVMSSTHFRIRLDVLGEGVVGPPMAADSFRMEAGFVGPHRPPGEILGLLLSDRMTLTWTAEPSAVRYRLYRGSRNGVQLPSDASCLEPDLRWPVATDGTEPIVGQTLFYLVTAINGLGEEGTRGLASGGSERPLTTACP